MFSVNVQNNIVALKDMQQRQLGNILNWYNMSEEYKFATGIEGPVGLETLECKLTQTACSDMEFFLGIHSFFEDKLVGIITGKIDGNVLWIKMMAIGSEFQGKGYGSISLDLLLKHLSAAQNIRDAYIAVADENIKGRGFWKRNGFNDTRQLCHRFILNKKKYNVIIMKKRL